jgi:serine phosphatase RsbU (regulator of sigma subunit)
VLAIGLLVTAALAVTALVLYRHNERRLLNLRVREVGLLIGAASPAAQTPLASSAALADATGGDRRRFSTFMAPFVGTGKEFSSVSLWRLQGSLARPVTALGATPQSLPQLAVTVRSMAAHPGTLNLTGMLARTHPALGFEYATGATRGVAVFAEKPLPANRRSKLESHSAFSDLDSLLYLGRSERRGDLLLSSLKTLPVRGLKASDPVPFGSSFFTLVVTPRGSLSGAFFQSVPWITALVGLLGTLAGAAMTDRLARRRRGAEELARQLDQIASETRDRYIEQRSIAQTLQHELLPEALPEPPGLSVKALYVPAQAGGDVGGDWYDVVPLADGRALLVIGDVSGHGVEAATTMALVRHATLAYVSDESRPGAILAKLSDFVRSRTGDYFATVLCALIDVEGHSVTFASAGHLAPLVVNGHGARFVQLQADAPIGFPHTGPLRETTVAMPALATLVAFTDGLVERPGEVLDQGLERMRQAAAGTALQDDQLLASLAQKLTSETHRDDTALVSIRWQS